jgi:hypothetical protein
MYKIIGGDQKEYGPVTFEQLLQWIRDNRANAQTLVQKESGPWVPLGSLPEFADALAQQQGAPPPTPEPLPQPGAAPPLPVSSGAYAAAPGLGGPERAREMVQGPAMALLITGILCVIFAIIGLVMNLMGASFRPPPGEIPPEMQPFFDMLNQMQGPMAIVSSLVGLAISGLIIYAAQKMRVLEGFALVVTATILAMVPCTSPCCCIGIPVGIWVLVVLFKPEVKAAFR